MHKQGFTLTEVLITLAIIGVVAALTVPSLITNINKQQYESALKEIYSSLNSALINWQKDNNTDTINGQCNIYDGDCFRQLFVPYLSIAKNCSGNNSDNVLNNCFPGTYYNRMGSAETFTDYLQSGFMLSNGVSVAFYGNGGDCQRSGTTTHSCATIYVDVNGLKPPNTISKDIFSFYLYANTVIPRGSSAVGQNVLNNCTSPNWRLNENDGWQCTAAVILNMDYE